MKIYTFHAKIWTINENGPMKATSIKPTKRNKGGYKGYYIPNNSILIIYYNNIFDLYIGLNIEVKIVMKHIIALAIKLDVKEIKLIECAKMKDIFIWDKYVEKMKILLAI